MGSCICWSSGVQAAALAAERQGGTVEGDRLWKNLRRFSAWTCAGSQTQVELPIVEARQFLQTIKSSATAQRRRFLFCLLFVLVTLVALASHAVFVTYFTFSNTGVDSICLLYDSIIPLAPYVDPASLWGGSFVLGTFSRPNCLRLFSPCAPRCRWCLRCS